MEKEKLDKLIEYKGPFGQGSEGFWDDYEDILSTQILRYKITILRKLWVFHVFNMNLKIEKN